MAQIQYMFNKDDEYFTPAYAVSPIIKFLAQRSTVWCPFDKAESNFVSVLTEHGFNVVHGHIDTGQDFFNTEIPICDYIISNPPYSLKTEVFMRLFEINVPFAMLINFQGIFDNKIRFNMFKENNVEMLWLSPRVNYIKSTQNKDNTGVPFQSGYLCSKILPTKIEFGLIDKPRKEK